MYMADRSRTRSTGENQVQDTMSYRYAYGDGAWGPLTTRTATPTQYLKTTTQSMVDTVTDSFHSRKRRGEIIMNSLESNKTTITQSKRRLEHSFWGSYVGGIKYEYVYPSAVPDNSYQPFTGYADGALWYDINDLDVDTTNEEQLMLDQVYSKADPATTSALVTIAEARKTIVGLRQIFVKAYRLFHHLDEALAKLTANKHLGYRDYLQYGHSIADVPKLLEKSSVEAQELYLGFRYGIRPLIYDLTGTIKAFQKSYSNLRQIARARSIVLATPTQSTKTVDFNNFRTTWLIQKSCVAEVSAGLLYDISPGVGDSLTASLGLFDFMKAGWDLVPYSFVVDWFLDVGNHINTWTPVVGVSRLGTWCTVRKTHITRVICTDQTPLAPLGISCSGAPGLQKVKQRVHLRRVANPRTNILPPWTSRPLGDQHFTDLLALLTQVQRRLHRPI